MKIVTNNADSCWFELDCPVCGGDVASLNSGSLLISAIEGYGICIGDCLATTGSETYVIPRQKKYRLPGQSITDVKKRIKNDLFGFLDEL